MCEPNDDWPCKFDVSPEVGRSNIDLFPREDCGTAEASCNGETDFTFPNEASADDDEEVTESKIRAFLDEKVNNFYQWNVKIPLYISELYSVIKLLSF